MKKLPALAASMLLILSANAFAATTAPALFTGVVTATCILTAGAAGIIAPNSDFTTLSSKNSGGNVSTVAAVSTGTGGSAFKISTSAPSSFTLAPADGNTNTSFSTTYGISGGASVSDQPGSTKTTIAAGTSTISVDMLATKSSGNFSQGAYNATITVTCE